MIIRFCRWKLWISRFQAAKRLKEKLSVDNILWWKAKSHSWRRMRHKQTVETKRQSVILRLGILKWPPFGSVYCSTWIRDGRLILLPIFKQIFLFPLKLSENHRFSDDFRGSRSQLIRLNSLNIRSQFWRQSLSAF